MHLHVNPADPKQVSADASVKLFERAGVPAGKLVLGIPFYGHSWTHVDNVRHGLFQSGRKSELDPAYNEIAGLLSSGEFTRYWDPIARVPYLYSSSRHTFVTYEDIESIRLKCQYVRERNLAGVMFWEYSNDSSGELLNAISRNLQSAMRD